jgi:hypothetical protein
MNIRSCFLAASATALLAILDATAAPALKGIVLSANSELSFGQIISTASPGAVTVTPGGARTSSGGVVLGSSAGFSPASFTVSGDANANYVVTLPASTTFSADGSSMTVDTFTSSPSGSGILGAGGTQTLSVGATPHVGATQHSAAYSGSYSVTVAYN